MSRYFLELADEELALLLDGKVKDEKTKAHASAAVRRLAFQRDLEATAHIASFIADVVSEALRLQKLDFWRTSARTCEYCGNRGGYALHQRSRDGHLKGTPNHNRPLSLSAVRVGEITACATCYSVAEPLLLEALSDVDAEISRGLTGVTPGFRRLDAYACEACKRQFDERELGHRHHVCPSCRGALKRSGFILLDLRAESVIDGLAGSAL